MRRFLAVAALIFLVDEPSWAQNFFERRHRTNTSDRLLCIPRRLSGPNGGLRRSKPIPQPENTTIGEEYAKGDIVIVNHERSLYFVEEPGHAIRYPVAIGTLDDQWDGVQTITAKRENPRWFPSEDIRPWSLPDLKTRSGRGQFT